MENKNQPVIPGIWKRTAEGKNDFKPVSLRPLAPYEHQYGGLTKREAFSAQALEGLLANPKLAYEDIDALTQRAIYAADLLLLKLDKPINP